MQRSVVQREGTQVQAVYVTKRHSPATAAHPPPVPTSPLARTSPARRLGICTEALSHRMIADNVPRRAVPRRAVPSRTYRAQRSLAVQRPTGGKARRPGQATPPHAAGSRRVISGRHDEF